MKTRRILQTAGPVILVAGLCFTGPACRRSAGAGNITTAASSFFPTAVRIAAAGASAADRVRAWHPPAPPAPCAAPVDP